MKVLLTIAILLFYNIAKAQSPLDVSFGSNGINTLNAFNANHCIASDIQADGKILCYYTSSIGCFSDFIFRLLPNGILDTSFNPGQNFQTNPVIKGLFYMSVSGSSDGSIIRQTAQGSIIVGSSGYATFKLNANGTIDNSYGLGGFMNLNIIVNSPYTINAISDFYEDVTNAAYYFASYTVNRDTMLIVKTFTNGQLDNSYGTNGIRAIALPNSTFGTDAGMIFFSKNGAVFIVGYSNSSTGRDCAITKYTLNGTLDNTFGTNGKFNLDFNSQDNLLNNITQNQNGDIYAYGVTSGNEVYILKLNSVGILDLTFGNNGKKYFPVSSTSNSSLQSVPYLYNSSLCNTLNNNTNVYMASQSYHAVKMTGLNDNQFGNNGTWNTTTNYRVSKMQSQPDGKIISFGSDSLHARIFRYNANQVFPASSNEMEINKNNMSYHKGIITIENFDKQYAIFQLYSIDGKCIYTFNTNDIKQNGNNYTLHLPKSIASNMYIFSAKNKTTSQHLKIAYIAD
jgi:uncharacterized delta-60 repeat protein